MLQPTVRRTWAPKGETPRQKSWDRHDRLSAISAITISPKRCRLGLVFQVHRENIRSDHVVTFLRLVHRRLGNGLLVVMDRLGAHRAAVRRLHEAGADWLDVEWLPAYAPDLNPDEQVWNHAKYSDLANFLPEDLDHLERSLCDSLSKQSRSPDLLRSYCEHAKLKLPRKVR